MASPLESTPPMYCMRPYFEIKKVKLPDCMYTLKPLHQMPSLSPQPPSHESTASALSYLERRQEWVLSEVAQLQDRVMGLGKRLGVTPADVGILQQVGSRAAPQEIVVACPPSSPPYSLLVLLTRVSRTLACSCRVFVHSSVQGSSVTDNMRNFFAGLYSSHSCPQLRLSLIWKSESICPYPTMLISPHNQTPIEGLANIARFISREFSPELYEGLNAEDAAKIDSWLDLIAITLLYGSSKEKTSVLRKMNSQLGGSAQFLVGDRVSLADVVAYCEICSLADLKPTANVKQWIGRCRSLAEFSQLPCVHLSSENS